MIHKRWNLWSFIIRRIARSQGFLDPIALLANLQRFGKPSDVWVPTELLRSGAVLQARGLMNSQAIQHNLDWIWPYWVQRQFDPKDDAFIPRAFNITHINLTHRNWTAVGLPNVNHFPIIDARGLVTPHFDGWSIDAWVLQDNKEHLIPSRLLDAKQEFLIKNELAVSTLCVKENTHLLSRAEVFYEDNIPVCRVSLEASADSKGWLAVSIRPYNPEGVSFINNISLLSGKDGWKVDGKFEVLLDKPANRYLFSDYSHGDVFEKVYEDVQPADSAECEVGMATAVALYEIKPHTKQTLTVHIPLAPKAEKKETQTWDDALKHACKLEIPDKQFQFLYEAALSSLVLHSPEDVYPGPYTYKRFWFRDAVFILNAMLSVGLTTRAEKVLDRFSSRQTPLGYFLSQDGEWDSNGQALWILDRFCRFTNQKAKSAWMHSIHIGAGWIKKKRVHAKANPLFAGLFPAGFSAEHFGPNDYYYWDDFWGIAGLHAAASLMESAEEKEKAEEYRQEALNFNHSLEESLKHVRTRLKHDAIPASPYRRMDAGAIGSIAGGYPLQLMPAQDKRLLATADFLIKKCFLYGGFYQEISHSGINAYLTLHVAQVLLRARDDRFLDIAHAIASLATSTGQWPEAIHPRTKGGCMGDGQHIWASAEWVLLIRNMFVREEGPETLILASGIPDSWIRKNEKIFFGEALTDFGKISLTITREEKIKISWEAQWHGKPPAIEVWLPGHPKVKVPAGQNFIELESVAK